FMIVLINLFLTVGLVFSQGKKYDGPDDPAGDVAAEREGFMTGNRVYLYFQNTTELSRWPKTGSRWPNTYEGVEMLDGIGLLIGAMVYITEDSIPVTDPDEINNLSQQGKLDTLYFLQTSYREEMDTDPTGTVEWGLYPVFGYFNPLSEYPAMSNDSLSWPTAGWPASGDILHWEGEWDGRFGRGVIYADLETYFVTNDAQDQEYLGPEDKVKYYPRHGVKIGDKLPDVTIQCGKPWGGLGIRVEQRGFQWNNPQARDALFWEYTIANISDYDIKDVAFGYWVDNGIGDTGGGGDDDELGYFDRKIDMAYSWDIDGVGQGGLPTGIMGFAYLESPGLAYDEIDNDEDGLVDEKRDNPAGNKIGPTDDIADLAAFLEFYRLSEEDLHEHYEGDEDQDWQDGEDINGNGRYDPGEYTGDDVGLDGVGPNELNYKGPDEGECNHKPDYVEGIGCEPNFAETDVSESDMVGLTSFMLFCIQPHRPPYEKWFRNDKSMWDVIGQDTLIEYLGNISNLVETFASGPFPLYKGRTERISMAELHSYDPLEGLNSDEHSAPALFEQKRIVQVIYEKDYRFAQPPKMPTLTATAGDGRVILTWDDIADKKTRDPFAGNINDFEGYKLFRTTDKKMSDAEVITDGYGTPMFKKPIFQCDLKDDKYGFTDFGLVNGMGYNLGTDSGIKHYFVDTNVQNGRTYYYGIVAYDYGAPDIGPGIAPSENNMIIDLDEAEEVKNVSKNVQIVTPHQIAAGYVPDEVRMYDTLNVIGTGSIMPEILAKNSLKSGHTYKITFDIDTVLNINGQTEIINNYDHGIRYTNNGIKIFYNDSILVYEESPDKYASDNLLYDDDLNCWHINNEKVISTDVFDGLRLKIDIPFRIAEYDYENSGWKIGNSPIWISPTISEYQYFPWDYDIIFTDQASIYKGRTKPNRVYDETRTRIMKSDLILEETYSFYVVNKSFTDSSGSYEVMDMIVHDQNGNDKLDMVGDRILVGPITSDGKWGGTAFTIVFLDSTQLPKAGDVYHLTFNRPFWITDSIKFTVVSYDSLDKKALKYTMRDIKVVPNPYVGTNAMEPSVANWALNQRRRLLFTHLPAQCTIKIFTVSGVLVDKIEVNNSSDNGMAHWDMLTKEGLEIAAGMYIYHIKAKVTGDEKVGKFAVIK
ncbi:MAG: hypothetical protein DRP89_02735, partial [Candidatus Neomarinimicrobiota bacterium]